MIFDKLFLRDLLFISKGILTVLFFGLVGFFIGVLMALLMTVLSFNKYLNMFVRLYVSIIRGIPLMCQIAFCMYLLPSSMSSHSICLIGFFLNSSAYLIEVFRNFIISIPPENLETAKGFGMSKVQVIRYIIIPQMLLGSIPLLIAEIISLAKEVSILSSFGIMEIVQRSNIIGNKDYRFGRALLLMGLVYYFLIFLLSKIEIFVEKYTKEMRY